MSMPKMPETSPIKRTDAINMLIASISMEEIALSHILNAEGEKIQYILGTLDGNNPGEVTAAQVLEVNRSVERMIRNVIKTEMLLQFKLDDILDIPNNS